MMMKNSTTGTIVAVAAMLLGSIQVFAATVDGISGPVFVNKGNGFVSVTGATQIGAGDVVMARDGGRAEVIYADGCRTRVEAGQSVSVAGSGGSTKDAGVELSPCAAGGAAGLAGGIAPSTLLVGAAVVAAGVGAAVLLSNNDSKPSSP
jgi:hypothetical protein